jgi:AraC-like DNA-binding protein
MTVAAGQLFLVPPGAGCRLLRDRNTVARGVSFGRSLVDPLSLDSSVSIVVETLAGSSPLAVRLTVSEYEEARALFSFLEKESEQRRVGWQEMVRLKLTEAILLLLRGHRAAAGQTTGGPIRFHPEEAMEYLRERYAEPLSLAGVASRYGLNPSYFSRLFHKHAGVSLVEFVNRTRIQKSCQLLKRSDAGIVEIAFAVGYNNLSHFNRYFRRVMGMSPREYRVSAGK